MDKRAFNKHNVIFLISLFGVRRDQMLVYFKWKCFHVQAMLSEVKYTLADGVYSGKASKLTTSTAVGLSAMIFFFCFIKMLLHTCCVLWYSTQ